MAGARAQLNYLRIAPRKVRLVAGLLKGLSVNEAEAQLVHQPRRAAKPLLKLLRSAVHNARQNQRLNPDHLYIESIRVDQGPMLKRYLPRARGVATPIQKKMSHITLTLSEDSSLAPPRFKIAVEKKVKLPPGETKPKKQKKEQPALREEAYKPRQSGFLRRFFRRKATAGGK